MDLQGFRNYVRLHLDLDAEDIADELIDEWAKRGHTIIARRINDWPFYEDEKTIPVVAGANGYTVALARIERIVGSRGPIARLDHGEAENRYLGFGSPSGPVDAYSTWKGLVYVWPTPSTDETLTARGYRSAADWTALGAGTEPDLPADFHGVLLDYVMAQALLHQEDPELASTRMEAFTSGLGELLQSEQQSSTDGPIVVGGATTGLVLSRPRFPWE